MKSIPVTCVKRTYKFILVSNVDKASQYNETYNDPAEYKFTFEAHEVCSQYDVIEVLETNLHCSLDGEKIGKDDTLRHFVIQKISEGIYKVTAKKQNKKLKRIVGVYIGALLLLFNLFSGFLGDLPFNQTKHGAFHIKYINLQLKSVVK